MSKPPNAPLRKWLYLHAVLYVGYVFMYGVCLVFSGMAVAIGLDALFPSDQARPVLFLLTSAGTAIPPFLIWRYRVLNRDEIAVARQERKRLREENGPDFLERLAADLGSIFNGILTLVLGIAALAALVYFAATLPVPIAILAGAIIIGLFIMAATR